MQFAIILTLSKLLLLASLGTSSEGKQLLTKTGSMDPRVVSFQKTISSRKKVFLKFLLVVIMKFTFMGDKLWKTLQLKTEN